MADELTITLTLTDLKSRLPSAMAPWVENYGPQMLMFTAEAVKDFIERLIIGDVAGVYAEIRSGMTNDDAAADRRRLKMELVLLNKTNAAKMKWQREAADAMGRILLTLLLAIAGF